MLSTVLNTRNSAYSQDNFRPIDEGIALDNPSLEGTIPNAQGTCMREGPNLRREPLISPMSSRGLSPVGSPMQDHKHPRTAL
ncbi:MAG: hypothetical protein P8K76_16765 [Candidatus Binatia bacterium]|nr:hypothetical protein [Candidatus Binatia bacterium]MDG2011415.1 hypothetical protein [Candidatus Binatia bacterium]